MTPSHAPYKTLIDCMGDDWSWIVPRCAAWLCIVIAYAIFACDNFRLCNRLGWRANFGTNGLLMIVFLFCGLHRIFGLAGLFFPAQRWDTVSECILAIACVIWTITKRGHFPEFITRSELLHKERELVIKERELERSTEYIAMLERRLKSEFGGNHS